MRFKSIFIVLSLFISTSCFALKVSLLNSTKTMITAFKLPNNVTYGPVNPSQTVALPHDLSKKIANKTGEVIVTFSGGEKSCGTVTFFNGKTSIEIKELSQSGISCDIHSKS